MTLSTSFIAISRGRHYLHGMAAQCFRLLALLALVLMPFTMASAPASAHAGQPAMMQSSGEHCADHQDSGSLPASDMTQCMLMCAAIPAAEAVPVEGRQLLRAALRLQPITPIHGIILDIATPPPRS